MLDAQKLVVLIGLKNGNMQKSMTGDTLPFFVICSATIFTIFHHAEIIILPQYFADVEVNCDYCLINLFICENY